jgi:hypothetical protein
VKVEVTPVLRGVVFDPEVRAVSPRVEEVWLCARGSRFFLGVALRAVGDFMAHRRPPRELDQDARRAGPQVGRRPRKSRADSRNFSGTKLKPLGVGWISAQHVRVDDSFSSTP